MNLTIHKTADFGRARSGLATVGYTVAGQRVTAGVAELAAGSGVYAAAVTVPSGFSGPLLWDTGEDPPAYAADEINPGELAASGLEQVFPEPGVNARQSLAYTLDAALANLSGNGGTPPLTLTVRDIGDGVDRFSFAVDAGGNRTGFTVLNPA